MANDWLRAGGSMWLDALLYDGRSETESLIAEEASAAEVEREASSQVSRRGL